MFKFVATRFSFSHVNKEPYDFNSAHRCPQITSPTDPPPLPAFICLERVKHTLTIITSITNIFLCKMERSKVIDDLQGSLAGIFKFSDEAIGVGDLEWVKTDCEDLKKSAEIWIKEKTPLIIEWPIDIGSEEFEEHSGILLNYGGTECFIL